MNIEKCQSCQEPTKRPAGFYDRALPDGTLEGGIWYTCESQTCPEALEAQAAHEREMAAHREARMINAANGIDPSIAVQDRRDAEITGLSMARELGVSPSLVCDWERERKPWPVDMYERYMAVVSEKEARNG